MTKSGKKSIFLILLILVIPVMAYGIFQLNSLTVDERELTTIYRRQLESVLFSVNQVAQDKSSEVLKIIKEENPDASPAQLINQLSQFNFFYALYKKEINGWEETVMALNQKFLEGDFAQIANNLAEQNSNIVNRLVRYLEEGDFQKIESFGQSINYGGMEMDYQFFITKTNGQLYLNIYFFDAVKFIEQALVPKFQEMSQGDFIITCTRTRDNFQVYSTSEEVARDIESEQLDLLPQFEVGIAREGGTVEEAVNKRKNQNLIALGLLMVVMVIGVGLVFRNVQKEMELAQKKADFVSNVSHEIRTPLALINMFAETLLLGRVKDETKKHEYYEIITKEVSRLSNMLNRILSFSKIEANKRQYQKSPLDLSEIVEDVMNTYSYHLDSNGFEHSVKLSDQPLPIKADKEALIEVLVNLIDNGMKYSPNTKNLEVRTSREDDFAVVSIKDHGMGIARDQLDKLFEKFYRVPTGDVHDTKGSGLGLSIVKHIVDAHHGKVIVNSKPGEGSEFKVLIPIKKE